VSGSDAYGETWLVLGSGLLVLAVIVLVAVPDGFTVGGVLLGAGVGLVLFGTFRAWLGMERKHVPRRH